MDATFLAEQGAFTLTDLTPALLVGSLVLLVSVAAVRLSVKSGLPSLLMYLAIGLAIGESGLGIQFNSAELTQVLGYAALVLILAEGGLSTSWQGIRRSVGACRRARHGGGRHLGRRRRRRLPLPARPRRGSPHCSSAPSSASTDAAAVFSVLRRVPLPRRITGMLEAESGFNDAPVVILVTALATASADPARHRGLVGPGLARPVELAGGVADRARRRLAGRPVHATGRVRVLGPVRDRGHVADRSGLRRRGRRCTPAGSSPATSRRWCWATWPCRTGPRSVGLRHRDGLVRPDRAVRPARPAGLAPGQMDDQVVPRHRHRAGAAAGRPPAVGAGLDDAVPDAAGATRPSCRGPGCAAPCPSSWRPCP